MAHVSPVILTRASSPGSVHVSGYARRRRHTAFREQYVKGCE